MRARLEYQTKVQMQYRVQQRPEKSYALCRLVSLDVRGRNWIPMNFHYRIELRNMWYLDVGVEEFILFSNNWEIKGISMNSSASNVENVLAPISHIAMASSVDFEASK